MVYIGWEMKQECPNWFASVYIGWEMKQKCPNWFASGGASSEGPSLSREGRLGSHSDLTAPSRVTFAVLAGSLLSPAPQYDIQH